MSDSEFEDFGQSIADAVESFLVSLQGVSRDETAGTAIPLLLLCTSQVMSAGARLGVQQAFEPNDVFQPDVGPDPDLDEMRVRLAALLGDLDTYAHNFEPYDPDTLPANLSDDLTSMAADLANGLRHFRAGNAVEALWWWQFSYLSNWGTIGCGVMSALHSVVAHDALDTEIDEADQVAVAEEVLGG
ncbi:MAG TPA: DUF5063 domain-containing protein [Marmoricola sp.]|nr:DUF5063 domain-containing protein [Marmoricola sp.]